MGHVKDFNMITDSILTKSSKIAGIYGVRDILSSFLYFRVLRWEKHTPTTLPIIPPQNSHRPKDVASNLPLLQNLRREKNNPDEARY